MVALLTMPADARVHRTVAMRAEQRAVVHVGDRVRLRVPPTYRVSKSGTELVQVSNLREPNVFIYRAVSAGTVEIVAQPGLPLNTCNHCDDQHWWISVLP